MDIKISKHSLSKIIDRVAGVADRKSSLPILANVLLTADGNRLTAVGTDLTQTVRAFAEAAVKTPGRIAVKAEVLRDIAKNLPAGDAHITTDKSGAFLVKSGKSKFKLPTMDAGDFPPLPTDDGAAYVHVDTRGLARLITATKFSAATDDTRPHLNGALLESTGKILRMVTTDGHRLSKAEHEGDHGKWQALIPLKGLDRIAKLLDGTEETVGLAMHNGHLFLTTAGLTANVKLSDEKFPPYSKVIPSSHKRRVVTAREALTGAIKRIALVSDRNSGGIRFELEDGTLRITSESPDVGEASEELDVDYSGEGLAFGCNAKFVLEALGALQDDDIAIELSDALDPVVLKPLTSSEWTGVLMPMRI